MKFMKRIASFAVAFAVAFGSSAYLPALSEKCAVPDIKASASCPREIMLDVCKAEVGYVSGYHKANKYTKWYGPIAGYADGGLGFPWCATFIAWCAAMAGCSDVICVTASCSYQWAHTSGTKHTSKDYIPQPGDLIYYGDFDHVGIVEWFDAENWIIHTIEGNYDQQVTRVERPYDSFVYGFITPEYEWQDPILPGHAVSTYAVPFSFSVDSYIHVYDRYGNYQDNHYTEPGDWCTIDEIYDNGYAHLIYPINGVDNGDYYCKLSDFERWIPNPRPSMNTPWITFDKASYTAGDTVNVSWTASPGDSDIEHYWVIVTAPSGEIANFDPCGTSYSFTTAESGTYTVRTFATPHNSEHGEGSLTDTKEITVNAPKPAEVLPTFSSLSSDKYNYALGENIVFTASSDNNAKFTIGINDGDGTRLITRDMSSGTLTIPTSELGIGTYYAYVTSYNSAGYVDSSGIWFLVSPKGAKMSAGAGKTISNGDYVIVSKMSDDLYLDIPGADAPAADGKVLTIYNGHPGKGSDYDAWTVTYLNNGYYKITQKDTDMALDLYEISLNRGTRTTVRAYTGTDSQQWSVNKTDKGYQIQSKSTGWVLDVAGGNTTPGTVTNVWEDNGNNAQLWSFSPFASDDKPESASKYPVVSYEVSGRQFRLKWNAVTGAEKYGIAVYQSSKWKLMVQTAATSYTSPKISRGTYKIAVCAKIGNKWDTTNIKNRAFALTIQ